MAMKEACLVKNSVKNTGKECDTAMGPTAMLIPIDPSVKFTENDLIDPVAWMLLLIHQRKAFPLFGQKAPIRTITNDAGSDVTVTMDDGSIFYVRDSVYNRTFETTSGGLCYADSLRSFLNSGMSILEVDQNGQMLVRKNQDKTYSGLITNYMSSPSPLLPDFKTIWRSRFTYSFTPGEMVSNGKIFSGGQALLALMGLVNAEITDAGAQTTTKIRIGVRTECAHSDLVALFGTPLAAIGNFVIKNAAGTVVTPASAAIVNGVIEITGTFPSGIYTVTGADPSVWFTANVKGYDGSQNTVSITVS